MTTKVILSLCLSAAAICVVPAVVAAPALAQSGESGALRAAIDAGTVGEKADGYLGIRGQVPGAVRAEVDSINIRRRAVYTERVSGRPISVEQIAGAIGCRTLTRVRVGQSYQTADGAWHVRGQNDSAPSNANCPSL